MRTSERREIVEDMEGNTMIEFVDTDDRRKAVRLMPWAAKIIKVEGGYKGFEFMADYKMWRSQR